MATQANTMAQRVRQYERANRYLIQLTAEFCTLDGHWTSGEKLRGVRLRHLLKLNRYRHRVMRVRAQR